MAQATFDALEYARELEAVGFTREQAEAQAKLTRQQAENQAAALQKMLDKYDETQRRELATKGDAQDVWPGTVSILAELKRAKNDLIKCQIIIGATLGTLMLAGFGTLAALLAKGFGWVNF